MCNCVESALLASSVDGQLRWRKIKAVAKVVQLKGKAMVYWTQIAVMMIDIYRQVACDDVTKSAVASGCCIKLVDSASGLE